MKVENIAAGLVALLAAAGPTFAAGTTSSKPPPHPVPATRTAEVIPGLAALVASGTGTTRRTFPDVPADHWAAQAVQLMADMGIMIGYPNGTFNGGDAR